MQLGGIEIRTISGGTYSIDGGTMFGVVPRVLWERNFPTDDKHRIPQHTNCVLVRTSDKNVLIDTGYGSKLPDKQRRNLLCEDGEPVIESLASAGLTREDIDVVVLSHLHFDHAGGATCIDENGDLVPTFPNAEYVAGRREWTIATADYPELRTAYPQENLQPLRDSRQLRLIDDDAEIMPGIRAILTGGHTEGHQAIIIEDAGETAIYLGDICCTWRHLPILWCLSYDVDLLQTRRSKAKLLNQVADDQWLAIFNHDPDVAAARIHRDDRKDFAIDDPVAAL